MIRCRYFIIQKALMLLNLNVISCKRNQNDNNPHPSMRPNTQKRSQNGFRPVSIERNAWLNTSLDWVQNKARETNVISSYPFPGHAILVCVVCLLFFFFENEVCVVNLDDWASLSIWCGAKTAYTVMSSFPFIGSRNHISIIPCSHLEDTSVCTLRIILAFLLTPKFTNQSAYL